jgi:hypothetical protein
MAHYRRAGTIESTGATAERADKTAAVSAVKYIPLAALGDRRWLTLE